MHMLVDTVTKSTAVMIKQRFTLIIRCRTVWRFPVLKSILALWPVKTSPCCVI